MEIKQVYVRFGANRAYNFVIRTDMGRERGTLFNREGWCTDCNDDYSIFRG